MKLIHGLTVWALVGCVQPEAPIEIDDPQDPPVASVPVHETEDGERPRLVDDAGDGLPDDVLASRLEQSLAAFVGEVVAIEHADVTLPKRGSVPHRFVTWRVDEPIKGAVVGETVTLRFL